MGWVFCATPHVLHLLPQAHRGRVKAQDRGERHREICTWIIPVSNPVPLLLLPGLCGNYSSGVWYRLLPGQGPSQHPEHLKVSN